ncbi:O-antigen ligase family protein [Patescibacteria group bacterium]|nr:O-antigen ligase family protein [Patescibacteria group bacterium]
MTKALKASFFVFQLFIISLPFGQLVKIQLVILPLGANIYLYDIFLALSLLFGVRAVVAQLAKHRRMSLVLATFLLLSGAGLLARASVYPFSTLLVGFLYLFRWTVYILVFFLSRSYLESGLTTKKTIYSYLGLVGFFSVAFGLIQYFVWPDLRLTKVVGWDPHYYRSVGTFLDPGFTSLVYALTIFLFLTLYLDEKKKIYLYLLGLSFFGLALTYARSGYVAFLAGMLILSWLKKEWRYFGGALALLTVTVLLLPRPGGEGVRLERTSTIEARLVNYAQTFEIIEEKPIFGVGFNLYRQVQKERGFLGADWQENHAGGGADSSLLLVMAMTGAVGLFLYLLYWEMATFGQLPRSATLGWMSLSALLVHSTFLNSQFYPIIMAWVWLVVSLGVRVKSESR